MVDSTYASMSGGSRRSSKPVAQDPVSYTSDQMWSPTMSAVSHGTHMDSNGFMLHGSDAASITGNFDSLDISSQRALWTANGSTATTPVSLDFIQTVSPVAQRRPVFPPFVQSFQTQHVSGTVQESGLCGMSEDTVLQPQSPDMLSQRTGPSRSSSRATLSVNAAGSRGSTYGPAPLSVQATAAYGGVPMHRQTSGSVPTASYLDTSIVCPVSPVLTAELSASTPGYQAQVGDEWESFVNMDETEHDLISDAAMRAGSAAAMKFEGSGSETRRASADDENARSDPLYQCAPGADGQYHCPFVKSEDCDHPPVKLKCNYDKYIDSHLRPFRCKVLGCEDTPFSSTACLLRHQREAHAMHGHGHKPNLCHWPECDRSKPSNGFPRRYNLLDHMKRVHGFNGGLEDASPGAGRRSANAQGGRVKGGRVEKSARKPTRAELEAQARAKKANEARLLRQHFAQRRDDMVLQLNDMTGLEDQKAVELLREGFAAIEDMQRRLAELG